MATLQPVVEFLGAPKGDVVLPDVVTPDFVVQAFQRALSEPPDLTRFFALGTRFAPATVHAMPLDVKKLQTQLKTEWALKALLRFAQGVETVDPNQYEFTIAVLKSLYAHYRKTGGAIPPDLPPLQENYLQYIGYYPDNDENITASFTQSEVPDPMLAQPVLAARVLNAIRASPQRLKARIESTINPTLIKKTEQQELGEKYLANMKSLGHAVQVAQTGLDRVFRSLLDSGVTKPSAGLLALRDFLEGYGRADELLEKVRTKIGELVGNIHKAERGVKRADEDRSYIAYNGAAEDYPEVLRNLLTTGTWSLEDPDLVQNLVTRIGMRGDKSDPDTQRVEASGAALKRNKDKFDKPNAHFTKYYHLGLLMRVMPRLEITFKTAKKGEVKPVFSTDVKKVALCMILHGMLDGGNMDDAAKARIRAIIADVMACGADCNDQRAKRSRSLDPVRDALPKPFTPAEYADLVAKAHEDAVGRAAVAAAEADVMARRAAGESAGAGSGAGSGSKAGSGAGAGTNKRVKVTAAADDEDDSVFSKKMLLRKLQAGVNIYQVINGALENLMFDAKSNAEIDDAMLRYTTRTPGGLGIDIERVWLFIVLKILDQYVHERERKPWVTILTEAENETGFLSLLQSPPIMRPDISLRDAQRKRVRDLIQKLLPLVPEDVEAVVPPIIYYPPPLQPAPTASAAHPRVKTAVTDADRIAAAARAARLSEATAPDADRIAAAPAYFGQPAKLPARLLKKRKEMASPVSSSSSSSSSDSSDSE
jgi:hypothetical protein